MPDTTAITMGDILAKNAPAMSATSDMPDLPDSPEFPVQETKPEVTEPAVETSETETPKVEATEKKVDTREDIDRERKRADDLQAQLKTAVESIERMTGQSAEKTIKTVQQNDPRPVKSQFDDPDEYETQFHAWAQRAAAHVARAESEKIRLEEDGKRQMQEHQRLYTERRASFVADHPDFVEVVENSKENLPIGDELGMMLFKSPIGPQLAYELAKNPKETQRIYSLPVVEQIYELGKLTARIESNKSKVSRAPGPITPLRSRASANAKAPDEESMEEYAARRMAEVRASQENPAKRLH